jgi:hypothetical protein
VTWPEELGFKLATGQKFPAGALILVDECGGLCRRDDLEVVTVRVGLSWRQAIESHLCAECLADMVVGASTFGGRVYAQANDGLFHEVTA